MAKSREYQSPMGKVKEKLIIFVKEENKYQSPMGKVKKQQKQQKQYLLHCINPLWER